MRRDGEPLSPRAILIVGLRLIGAWIFTQGYFSLTTFLDFKVLKFTELTSSAGMNPTSYLFYAASDFALALVFAVWAPNLAALCRPIDPEKPDHVDDIA